MPKDKIKLKNEYFQDKLKVKPGQVISASISRKKCSLMFIMFISKITEVKFSTVIFTNKRNQQNS